MKASKFSGYWIFVGAVTVGMAVLAYFKGSAIDPSPLTRVIGVLLIGAALLLARGGLTAAWRYVASRSPGRNARRYERDPAARVGATKSAEIDLLSQRVRRFKLSMQQAYGWRWRYQQPWLLVTGDQVTAETLSPGLSTTGWAATPEVVLFYTGAADQSDENWLTRIRGIRPRRPVDATVQIVRLGDADKEPFADDVLAHSLFSQSGSLGWAAPAYLLNVVDVDGVAAQSAEAVACTWSSRTAAAEQSTFAFTTLSRELADAGTQHLGRNRADRCRARLSQHIETHGAALSALVSKLNRARSWKTSVVGVFFTPLFKQQPADAANVPHTSVCTRATNLACHRCPQPDRAWPQRWFFVHTRRGMERNSTRGRMDYGHAGIRSGQSQRYPNRFHDDRKTRGTSDATQATQNLDTLQKQIVRSKHASAMVPRGTPASA
jgi:type VI secretion system protein ImpL